MNQAQVLSMFEAKPREVEFNGRTIQTGMYKTTICESASIHKNGFGNDFIGNLSVHGGELQAIYLYGLTAYEPWKPLLSQEAFHWGLFGENILLSELNESEIFVGDVFQLGQAVVQATAPRYPCGVFQNSTGYSQTVKKFCELQRPGVYLKVLQEGTVQKGDSFTRIKHQDRFISIQQFFIDYHMARTGQAAQVDSSHMNYYFNCDLVPAVFKERLRKS